MTELRKKNFSLLVLLLLAVASVVSLAAWRLSRAPGQADIQRLGIVELPAPKPVSSAGFYDSFGRDFGADSWRGKWTLVFFGFTNCPDICPATVSIMSRLARSMEGKALGDDTRYLMVSVDPERDTPNRLKTWLGNFHPKWEGITGAEKDIRALAGVFSVSFQKRASQASNYDMVHSANIFVVAPDGRYVGFVPPPHAPRRLEQAYRTLRLRYESS